MASSFPTNQAIVVGGGLGGDVALLSDWLRTRVGPGFKAVWKMASGRLQTMVVVLVFAVPSSKVSHLDTRGMSAANSVVENGGRVVLLAHS